MEEPDLNADRQTKMRSLLDGLSKAKNVAGATLITRDGLCVMKSDSSIVAPETFSAMSAALMAAAETAFYELGGAGELRVTAETERAKMVALGASDTLLLVVIGKGNANAADLLREAEASAREFRLLLSEG